MSLKSLSLLALLVLGALVLALFLPSPPTPAADLSPVPALEYEVVVVRAFFDDPQMVATLAAWKEPWEVDYQKGFLVVDVTAEEYRTLEEAGFRLEIDEVLTAELNRPREMLPGQVSGIPGYPCYRTVEETYTTAEDIVTNHPDLASWIDIGDSWEKTQNPLVGYDIQVLRLTNANIPGPKPKLFAMFSVHAREYTPAETGTRFAEYLVQNYGVDPDVTWILDYHEVHLLLQANPDGRKKAETGLLWRKNTNNNYCSNTNSRGADLNRNFQFQWGCCGGSSGFQCDSTYRGPSPASEPETQAVQNYVISQYPDLRDPPIAAAAPLTTTGVFLDVHSYSELVLWPWGFTGQPTGNGPQMQTLGRKLAYFNGYYPEQSIGLYPTDGTTDDFAYGELGLPAYTFELGTSFFQSCGYFENSILPDILDTLLYSARVVRAPYLLPAGPDALDLTFNQAAVAPGQVVTLTATVDDTRFNNQNGTEPVQNIAAAEYYIDNPPWITTTVPISVPMSAADGAFNSPVEGVVGTVDTTSLSNGRHTVFVRGRDAAGDWGPVSAQFLYVIDPLVAPIIQGQVTAADTGLPLTATLTAGTIFQTTTDPASGAYQMQVISGTYDLTADPGSPRYAPATVHGLVAQDHQTVQQDFVLYPYCELFGDDIESGNIGWTAQSPWAITTERSHSPTHSWTDSPGGNYGNNRNVSLTSPVLDLSGYQAVTLDFWQICDTEAGYDYCHVEVSDDGGTTWTEVATYDGPHAVWEQISLPVPMLDDQANARLRFRLTTDVSVTDDGWHLDDVQLRGAGPGCVSTLPPSASFLSSSPDLLGATTVFTNTSVGTALSYAWNFGDGSPVVTDTHPLHTYASLGSYTVVLTASNILGTDVATGTVDILEAAQAGFLSSSPDLLGETTVFTNTSSGSALTFTWDFGDGSGVVTEVNPTHVYTATGVYSVTLTASNAVSSDTASAQVEIQSPFVVDVYLPMVRRAFPLVP